MNVEKKSRGMVVVRKKERFPEPSLPHSIKELEVGAGTIPRTRSREEIKGMEVVHLITSSPSPLTL